MTESEIVNSFTEILKIHNICFNKEVSSMGYRADIVLPKKRIAIEAKLKDIKKAIRQSHAYSLEYKNVYLLMPFSSYGLIKKYKDTLKKLNIKWCLIKEDKTLQFGHYSWKKILFD